MVRAFLTPRSHAQTVGAFAAAFALAAVMGASHSVNAAGPAQSHTLGFIVTKLNTAVYESRFWDECPEGPSISADEYWWRGLSKEDRGRITHDGETDTNSRTRIAGYRGPHGEDVCWQPTFFKDPPIHEATGQISYGLNLDGTTDGHATATSCAHGKFAVSPDGQEKAVDNQLFRVLGCYVGWRNFKIIDEYANQERRSAGRSLILIEVTGVDDPRNDSDVDVTYYHAVDQMPRDPAGNILPYGSYRIDLAKDGKPRYGAKSHGRIVNGVLTSDPVDGGVPNYGNQSFTEVAMRGMRLKLEIAPDGNTAQGMIAGYYDLESFWHQITNVQDTIGHGDYDCPAMYEAMFRLADGYPDPKTGQCTAISSAFNIEASAAFVVHTEGKDKRSVQNAAPRPVQTAGRQ